MGKPLVVAYNRVSREAREKLAETCEVRYFEQSETLEDPEFREAVAGASAIIGVEYEVDEAFLEQAPCLRIAANVSVGYDNLDLEALSTRGVYASNTPEVLNDTTADAIFGLLLAAARRIPETDRYVKDGKWQNTLPDDYFGVDVHHRTLGIIGMGRIGEAIAKRARFGFDMNILYYNRSRKPEAEDKYGASWTELEPLLEQSDFVCTMTPLTKDTYHLMDEAAFRRMKASAVFINGSRGGVVDEEALVKAIQERWIWNAGVDVFSEEPVPSGHPLLKFPHVVTLPHIGSFTEENENNMSLRAAENVLQVLDGKEPQDQL
ncbi:D-glycerate dehydrogenase [Marinococcus halophilus]|uniref:Bifunctional glyoxylate/hydroxypyruvate reductase B n=1 Tax=Marinococcus halophilus TaxID=1371 RepID=A0A510Y4P0_MARHA|nr:D-glycerate dehydrogenase [Marinococcus halophilus]OZT81807.1 D-glycerate dehydrogenase [Marinococcus halophilus]GEK57771.1 bifunctional glyoxylate/hydroxypyruvate reductase B [Marinococcus halophilus]